MYEKGRKCKVEGIRFAILYSRNRTSGCIDMICRDSVIKSGRIDEMWTY